MVTIYALTCLANGKAYIGCTRGKVAKRFREHRCILDAGNHTEPFLQEDWKKFGKEMFWMETVMELEEDSSLHVLRGMEKFAMQRYKAAGLLYNTNEASFEPKRQAIENSMKSLHRHRPQSAESNLKRSLAQIGIPKNHGHKISATKRARKAMR